MKQAPLTCFGHSRPVVDVNFSGFTDCGYFFVTASKDGKAMLRRGVTGDWIGTFNGHSGAVWSCVLDQQALKIATGSADFTAKIWNALTGKEMLSIPQEHIVRSVELSKTDFGSRLITANNKKHILMYDLSVPETALCTFLGHEQLIRRVSWCNEDRNILSISEDCTMRLWDASGIDKPLSSQQIWSKNLSKPITDIHFRRPFDIEPLATMEVAVACENTIQLYRFDWRFIQPDVLPEPIATHTLSHPIYSLSLHPTENILLCGSEDHCAYRLDLNTGEVLETCKGHFGPVHCIRFSPDGKLFCSGSEDGTVRLWQTNVGEEFGLWKVHLPDNKTTEKHSTAAVCISNEIDILDAKTEVFSS